MTIFYVALAMMLIMVWVAVLEKHRTDAPYSRILHWIAAGLFVIAAAISEVANQMIP